MGKRPKTDGVVLPVEQPNPIQVAWRVVRVLARTRRPAPNGSGTVDHSSLIAVLQALAEGGIPAVAGHDRALRHYVDKAAGVDPDALSRHEALAFWVNLYNAGAVDLAAQTYLSGAPSVLRTPGGFSKPIVAVDGEPLSLDAIEHGKIRRFGDPRIHGALVCGSLSCPTLRSLPYSGTDLDKELDNQMVSFLQDGGAQLRDDVLWLSRVLLWFGTDFVRPHRMPTFIPTSKKRTLRAIRPWLPEEMRNVEQVRFQDYDWTLGCQVR